jgi:hypothetical protein
LAWIGGSRLPVGRCKGGGVVLLEDRLMIVSLVVIVIWLVVLDTVL